MASQLACDLCQEEPAVLMQTNLTDGSSLTIGAACIPMFFGGAVLGAIGSDGHAGTAGKCQACRRTHERMTTPVTQLAEQPAADPPLESGSADIEPAAGQ